MPPDTPRQQAIALIATYDRPDADAYERHIARLARSWLTLVRAGQARQGMVNRILDEIAQPPPPGYGCGWDEFKRMFTAWAQQDGWLEPDGKRKPDRKKK
jgi:hypothetical protein